MNSKKQKQVEIVINKLRAQDLHVMASVIEGMIIDYEMVLADNEKLNLKLVDTDNELKSIYKKVNELEQENIVLKQGLV